MGDDIWVLLLQPTPQCVDIADWIYIIDLTLDTRRHKTALLRLRLQISASCGTRAASATPGALRGQEREI